MNIVAYCRVSTNTDDQLNSLDTQKKFFEEFAEKNNYNLIKIYADEGISGTKLKKRKEFLKLMSDAERGLFDLVVVKDISRFARNAVDFLQSIRKLKSIGIGCNFVNANLTSQDGEMILGTLALVAQEESSNTSKRIKFSKKRNAEHGKVPNLVYGYDKKIGEYFSLDINQNEATIIKEIYSMYLNEAIGANKIAKILNDRGLLTKRGCKWSQNGIARILSNELYRGKIINSKEQIKDFLTGERIKNDESNWIVTTNESLRIIDDETFKKVQRIMNSRKNCFKAEGKKQSTKNIFSTIIKCSECGSSFRKSVRRYKNTYVDWVCNGRNANGADYCSNKIVIDENELIDSIKDYFKEMLKSKNIVVDNVVSKFKKIYREKDENINLEKEINKKLKKLRNAKEKYMDMYVDDLITREELNAKTKGLNSEIEKLENELKYINFNLTANQRLETVINNTFSGIEDMINLGEMTNAQLKKIIDKIVVSPEGKVDIFLKLLSDVSIDKSVLLCDNRT